MANVMNKIEYINGFRPYDEYGEASSATLDIDGDQRPSAAETPDLTTGSSAYIAAARRRNEYFVRQPDELYSAENRRTWSQLFRRQYARWLRYALSRHLIGVAELDLRHDVVPRIDDVNARLGTTSCVRAAAVTGYVPTGVFFRCLARGEFPATITMRPAASLDFSAAPDLAHDALGHLPLLTYEPYAAFLVALGRTATAIVASGAARPSRDARRRAVRDGFTALARLCWFTVEAGLMEEAGAVRTYGGSLLSSAGEIVHALEAPAVTRARFRLGDVIAQPYDDSVFQNHLFVAAGFDQLLESAAQLEDLVRNGELPSTTGTAVISDTEIDSLLQERS